LTATGFGGVEHPHGANDLPEGTQLQRSPSTCQSTAGTYPRSRPYYFDNYQSEHGIRRARRTARMPFHRTGLVAASATLGYESNPTVFNSLKHRIKTFCLETENQPVRLVLDQFLKHRASHRIALTDHRRVHAAICGPLQAELGKILSFSSEFESELYVRRFELDFAKRCNRRFAVGTHSGTSALQLALVALNIGPGDEVITVPYTYIATALAISNTGAKPVFVDIEDATFNIDPRRIESAITPRTKAIMPVHLFGQMAGMPEIMRIAAAHGLRVIEDACQAFGAELGGEKAGSHGDVGCFSFSTPKNLVGPSCLLWTTGPKNAGLMQLSTVVL
jgi:hypothetical protein